MNYWIVFWGKLRKSDEFDIGNFHISVEADKWNGHCFKSPETNFTNLWSKNFQEKTWKARGRQI